MVDNLGNDDYDITTVFGLDLSAGGSFSLNALPTTPEGLIASANVSGDVQGILTQIAQAPGFGTLGAGALNAIGPIISKVALAAPAIDLIGSIASGHGPTDPQQVVGALAATASIANPLAGAIIGAAGEAVIGIQNAADEFFQAVGLISRPPPQYTYIGFVQKGSGQAPGGPWDPNWKTWAYWMTPVNQGWRWGTLPFTAESVQRERPFQLLLERLGRANGRVPYGTPPFDGPVAQNKFEEFFYAILKKDLENWMNAAPAIDPRQLLEAAAQIWNAKHTSSSVVKYSGFTSGGSSYDNSLARPIDFLLSAAGDTSDKGMQGFGTPGQDLTINMGDFEAQAKKVMSLAGLGRAAAPTAPKQSFSLAGRAATAMAPVSHPIAAPVASTQSLLQKLLPYAPAAVGIAAFPFVGPLALIGVVASAVIVGARRA